MKIEGVGLRLISFFNSTYYRNRKHLQSGFQISVALYFCVKYSKRLQSCLFTSQKAHMHYKIEHLLAYLETVIFADKAETDQETELVDEYISFTLDFKEKAI